MAESCFHGMARSERILAEKLDLLHRNSTAASTNIIIGAIVCALLWDAYPHLLLLCWFAVATAVSSVRIYLQRRFLALKATERCTACAAMQFAIGSVCSGSLWGVLCLGLPVWGDTGDYHLMILTGAGMTAGAVATISVYYPAYLGYTASFILPLALVCLVQPNPELQGVGVMMLIYLTAISLTARFTNRFINRTMELSVDNQILRASLDATRIERDAARTDKWSTLAQLSHELRTPLNAIIGFTEAMRDEIFGSLGHRRYKEYTDHILASGKNLLTLTNEMLLLSQGESGALVLKESDIDVTDLARALIETKAPVAAKAGLILGAKIDGDLPLLHADKIKLRQMLVNLVDNAIKFTPAGGFVTVSAELQGGSVVFSVRDSGIGMSQEQIPQALSPFGRVATALTNSGPGAGLGLPICNRLAELHGATLTIESSPGEGTNCCISFPPERTVAGPSSHGTASAAA